MAFWIFLHAIFVLSRNFFQERLKLFHTAKIQFTSILTFMDSLSWTANDTWKRFSSLVMHAHSLLWHFVMSRENQRTLKYWSLARGFVYAPIKIPVDSSSSLQVWGEQINGHWYLWNVQTLLQLLWLGCPKMHQLLKSHAPQAKSNGNHPTELAKSNKSPMGWSLGSPVTQIRFT